MDGSVIMYDWELVMLLDPCRFECTITTIGIILNMDNVLAFFDDLVKPETVSYNTAIKQTLINEF